jgi:hypothetical protein
MRLGRRRARRTRSMAKCERHRLSPTSSNLRARRYNAALRRTSNVWEGMDNALTTEFSCRPRSL